MLRSKYTVELRLIDGMSWFYQQMDTGVWRHDKSSNISGASGDIWYFHLIWSLSEPLSKQYAHILCSWFPVSLNSCQRKLLLCDTKLYLRKCTFYVHRFVSHMPIDTFRLHKNVSAELWAISNFLGPWLCLIFLEWETDTAEQSAMSFEAMNCTSLKTTAYLETCDLLDNKMLFFLYF